MNENHPPQGNATIVKAMRRIGEGQGDDELFFDPVSGQLVVQRPGEAVDPDSLPATQMARDGFFLEA